MSGPIAPLPRFRPRYSAPTYERGPTQNNPFPYQAAQFALWGPLIVVGLNCLSSGALNTRPADFGNAQMTNVASFIIGIVSLLILLVSLIMAVIALAAIPRLGRKQLLSRSLVGMTITLLMVLAAGYYVYLLHSLPGHVAARVTGEWNTIVSSPSLGSAHLHMSLNTDGSARLQTLDGPNPVNITGRWRIVSQGATSRSILELKLDTALNTIPPASILGWQIDRVTDSQLDIVTTDDNGHEIREIYTRTQ
jgi:hypothetical protein